MGGGIREHWGLTEVAVLEKPFSGKTQLPLSGQLERTESAPLLSQRSNGGWSRVKTPRPGSVVLPAGLGTRWYHAAVKPHSSCQMGNIGEDVHC